MNIFKLAVALAVTASCIIPKGGPTYRPASYGPAIVNGRQIEVTDSKGHYASLTLEAAWTIEGDRHCVRGGDISVVTPSGPMMLRRATACVTTAPFSLVGEAEVSFPGLGYLARVGVDSNSPRAAIAIGLGSSLKGIDIAGEPMALNPHQFYLSVDYFSGLKATLGTIELSTPSAGARLVVAPQEPMIYVAGGLTGVIDDAGFGFSADGRLPFAPKLALYDGSGWKKRRFEGHIIVHGSMPLHPYPLSVNGRFLLDVDANDDGRTMFEGDAADLAIAADGTLSLGYDKAGFGFSVELGSASVAYDRHRGLASFAAESSDGFFTGTPLSFIEAKNKTAVRGFFRNPNDFEISARLKSSAIAGYAVRDTEVRLSNAGISVRGTAKLVGIGEVLVEGRIDSKGGFDLRGRADLTVAGFRMANADVTLGTGGVKIAGSVDLPGLGKARVSGHVKPNGQFGLAGRATLAPAGLKLSNAEVKIGSTGAKIAGSVTFLGSVFRVRGGANARGEFSLSGEISIKAVALFGQVRLGISNRGASAAINGQACIGACIDLPGIEINTNGTICPTFPLIGRKCIKVLG